MEFWTAEYLMTVAGAIAATKIITTVVCNHAPEWAPKWVALIVAFAVQIAMWGASVAMGNTALTDWVALMMAVLNSFVVYAGATGVNAMTASRIEAQAVDAETFFSEAAAEAAAPGAGSARWF